MTGQVRRVVGLASARVIGTAANGIALILVARWTGPEAFGAFSIALSIQLAVAGALGLGLPIVALRSAALGRTAAAGYAIFLNLVTSVAAAVLGLVAAAWATGLAVWTIALLATSVALEKNAEVRIGLGTEFGRSRVVNGVLALRGLVVLVLVVGASALGLPPLVAFVAGKCAATAVAAFLLVKHVHGWRLVTRAPRDGSLDLLGGVAVENAVAAARQLDATLVGVAGGALAAGLYGAVQKVLLPITIVSGSLRVVVMGTIARSGVARARRTVRTFFRVALIGALVGGTLAIWAEPLVLLILGDGYVDAAWALRWMLLAMPAVAANPLVITVLQDKGRARWTAVATALFTALTLAGVWTGAALAGATGATLALAVVSWLRLLTVVAMSRSLRADAVDRHAAVRTPTGSSSPTLEGVK